MTQYNFDGRYEVIVYGVIKNGPMRGLIPNSDLRTDDKEAAIKAFNGHKDAPYGADIWDHNRCEDIAQHITSARREYEQVSA